MHDGFLLEVHLDVFDLSLSLSLSIYIYLYIYIYIAFGCPERLSPAFQGLCH